MLKNRYLMDRTMRRGMNDGRRYGRGRDRAMDYEHDYPKRDSRYDDRGMSDYRGQDYHRGYEQYGESHRPMEYEMYGVGGFRPRMNDYARGRRRNDYNDYGYDERDYAEMDKEYKKDLHEWIEKLKKKDRFGLTMDMVTKKAKEMGVKFEEIDELEYYAIYLAMVTDYSGISNDPHLYLAMAKDFIFDDDVEVSPSEKVCIYLYQIVLGEE